MQSTSKQPTRKAPAEAPDLAEQIAAALVEALRPLLAAVSTSSPEFVKAAALGISRPTLRRWEVEGKVRVLKAGREKLYNARDIAALAKREPEPAARPALAKVEDPAAALAAIAATVRAGGRR